METFVLIHYLIDNKYVNPYVNLAVAREIEVDHENRWATITMVDGHRYRVTHPQSVL